MAVQGLDRLKKRMAALPQAQLQAVSVALAKGAEDMSEAVRRAAPRGTGAHKLARSVGWAFAGRAPKTSATGALRSAKLTASGQVMGSSGLKVEVYAGDDDAYYARWVEFGTQPHSLRKGADISRGRKQHGGATYHPGARAQPFFYPTVRARKKSMKSRVAREANKAVKSQFNTRSSKG